MFAEGRPNTGRMLGYYLKDGQLTIIPEEAEIVRMIFDDYLSGMGRLAIAKKLNEMSIPTVRGTGEWREGSIFRILHNENIQATCCFRKPIRRIFAPRKELSIKARSADIMSKIATNRLFPKRYLNAFKQK